MKTIESLQNKQLKQLTKLQSKSRSRRQLNSFVVEGEKEVTSALNSGYRALQFFVCQTILDPSFLDHLQNNTGSADFVSVSKVIYNKLAYRQNSEGIIAVFKTKAHDLDSLELSENPLVLVAEAPEKPGNIGALLRTAEGADLDAVIIANPKTDLYNPNIIRSSVGCLFNTPIATGSTTDIIRFLKEKDIAIYAATLQNSNSYLKTDFTKPSALVVGTENAGLSEEWREAASQNIIIPMRGQNDSLNVSVSAGIFIFEALRQRG